MKSNLPVAELMLSFLFPNGQPGMEGNKLGELGKLNLFVNREPPFSTGHHHNITANNIHTTNDLSG